MKKNILTIILLCSFTSNFTQDVAHTAEIKTSHKRHRTDFKKLSNVIAQIDGILINAPEILDSLRAINAINEVQYGKMNKETKKREGSYQLADQKVTLQDLVKKEHLLLNENTPATDARWTELNTALTAAKDDFTSKLKALRKGDDSESDMAKKMKIKLIDIFIKDQNLSNSLLANADKSDEKEKMYAASATEFFRFLNDLKHFLEDLIESCTKAHDQYKLLVRQAQQK